MQFCTFVKVYRPEVDVPIKIKQPYFLAQEYSGFSMFCVYAHNPAADMSEVPIGSFFVLLIARFPENKKGATFVCL